MEHGRQISFGLCLITVFLSPVALGGSLPPSTSPPSDVPGDWWSAVQKNLATSEYQATWQENHSLGLPAWSAPNRANNFRTLFTVEGIRVIPRTSHRDEAPAWQWGLTLQAWGRANELQAVESIEPSANGNRVEYVRDGIVEWYVNDSRGLEQGFTIATPPEQSRDLEHSTNIALRLEFAISGNVTAALTDGGCTADFLAPGSALAIRFAELHAFDANGLALPIWFEQSGETLSLIVNDAGAAYPITIDPLATSPSWTAESDQVDAHFGWSVAVAGDVNGDGYSDVIVGARQYDNGQADEGRAFVYYGSALGLVSAPGWTAEGNQASAAFGWSVATAGDVNGDGYSDVIVGAIFYDNGETDEGRAYVYHGSVAGLSLAPSWTAEGNHANAHFSRSVATAGDVDGDGYSDVIIGGEGFDNGQTDEGRVGVYLGSASGLSLFAAWTAEGDQTDAYFGHSAATAGDVNGDGYSDVIVGAWGFDNGQTNEGAAFVYHGSASGLALAPAWSVESNQPGVQLGVFVATAGDVNGDGYSDVIVGAEGFDNGQIDEGWSGVYLGSAGGLSTSAAWTSEGNQTEAYLGHPVATAGDVNGDGYSDVIVGSRTYDNGQTEEGRAYVFLGSASGLSVAPAWTAESDQASAYFGAAVATAGDVNGDGYSDVIVGAYLYDNGQSDEGRAFVYHGSAAGLAAAPAWTAESDQFFAEFGRSVALAGDVNGDGYSDVIVGAINYDNGQTDEGRAFVYHGSAAGLAASPAWTAEFDQADAYFGISVATAGDVNGDGYSDVIVGAREYSFGQNRDGRAYVYHGSATGLAASPTWTAESDQPDARFGWSVATAGDVNGDGYGDVIVGAYNYDNGQTDEGRAYVHHGSAAGLSAAPAWTAESDQVGAEFGISVATAGDVNGDGYSDVIVGADFYDHGQTYEGRAYVYHGSAAGLAASPAWTAESDQANAHFGWSVATAGDVNGDGYGDVIVGADFYDNGQTDEGRAYVYHGSAAGLVAAPAWTAEGDQADVRFGISVATAGDVNGDGYSDVIVGAYSYDNGQEDEGRAILYLGSASGLSLAPDWTAESDQVLASFGISVATVGDVNSDGYSDVIVGAPGYSNGEAEEGRAFLYYGNDGAGLSILPRQRRADDTAPIAHLGGIESDDGFRLSAIGRSFMGRGRVALEWEVKPLGTLMDGVSTQVSSFVDSGLAGATLNELVTGLANETAYHWRARVRYDVVTSPFQQHGRWFSVHGNGWNETDLRATGCGQCQLYADVSPDGGDCIVELGDVLCILAGYAGSGCPQADIAPCGGDLIIELGDVLAVLGAYSGVSNCPHPCAP